MAHTLYDNLRRFVKNLVKYENIVELKKARKYKALKTYEGV